MLGLAAYWLRERERRRQVEGSNGEREKERNQVGREKQDEGKRGKESCLS